MPIWIKIVYWYNIFIALLLFVGGLILGIFGGGIFTIPLWIFAFIIWRFFANGLEHKKKYSFWLNLIFAGLVIIPSFVSVVKGDQEAITTLVINGGIIYCLLRKESRKIFM